MVVFAFKRIVEEDCQVVRFSNEPIAFNAIFQQIKQRSNASLIDGVSKVDSSLSIITKQSPLHDIVKMNDIKVGDKVKVEDSLYTIKTMQGPLYTNYNNQGQRKYVFGL